jgi:ABC-type sugar transport system permease subunit
MAATAGSRSFGLTRVEKRNIGMGLAFISPWLIGFLIFNVYPLISSFYYSLTRYDLIQAPVFIGLGNYTFTFTKDPNFWNVVYNTAYYVIFSVPLSIAAAFLIANLLNTKILGRSIFRGIIYIPSIVPAVCTAMVWLLLLNIQYGAINGIFLLALGAAWSELRLAPTPKSVTFWIALYGTYMNWFVTALAGVLGTGALSPITAPGRNALPWQEKLITAGFMSVGLAIVACTLLLLWGFRAKAPISNAS